MTEVSELKPCPFCGGEAENASYNSCDCCGKAYNGQVICRDCGAGVTHLDTDDEAIAAWNRRARPSPTGEEVEVDDQAVDQFAEAMKTKLAKKRAEGRGGWDDKSCCSAEFLSQQLREHVEKGDPLDVGNLAMMLHQRGERIMRVEKVEAGLVAWRWKGHNGKWVYEEGDPIKREMREYDGIVVEDLYSATTIAALEAERDEARKANEANIAARNDFARDWDAAHKRATAAESALATANARVAELEKAAKAVVWFDWSDNDPDAVKAITDLRAALEPPHEAP